MSGESAASTLVEIKIKQLERGGKKLSDEDKKKLYDEVKAAYDDLDAVSQFARNVEVVTFEFENVPAPTAEAAGRCAPVRPSGSVLHTTQQRIREKSFLTNAGLPTTPRS